MNSIVSIRRHRSGVVLSRAANDGQASPMFVAPKNPHVFERIRVRFSWRAIAHLPVCLSIVVNGGVREASCRMIHTAVSGKRIARRPISFIRKSSGLAMAAEMFVTIMGDCRTHEGQRRVRWKD
jgi:hypothetical protein